jgi:hypothetical protein
MEMKLSHTAVWKRLAVCGEGFEDLEVDGSGGRVSESVELSFLRS